VAAHWRALKAAIAISPRVTKRGKPCGLHGVQDAGWEACTAAETGVGCQLFHSAFGAASVEAGSGLPFLIHASRSRTVRNETFFLGSDNCHPRRFTWLMYRLPEWVAYWVMVSTARTALSRGTGLPQSS